MFEIWIVAVCVGLPLVSFAAFVARLRCDQRCPTRLLIAALVPSVILLPLVVWWTLQGDTPAVGILLALFPCVSIAALVWALLKRRDGGQHARLEVVGVVAPLPAMALLLLLGAIVFVTYY